MTKLFLFFVYINNKILPFFNVDHIEIPICLNWKIIILRTLFFFHQTIKKKRITFEARYTNLF
ncbi:hypothetical protein BD770DRAFT_393154 [Pilaira anomala]|nr:hypothetical protein BD770DRAFT_393154 [Pilaira anomala]